MSITTFLMFLFCASVIVLLLGDDTIYFFYTWVVPISIVAFIVMKLVLPLIVQRDLSLDRQYEQAVEENAKKEESALSSSR